MADEVTASPAVGGAGETPAASAVESSSPATEAQAGSEPSSTTTEATPADYRSLLKTDAELRRVVDEEANRLAQKREFKRLKDEQRKLAAEVKSAPDDATRAQKARELADRISAETDPEETESIASADRQRSALTRMEPFQATDEYRSLYDREGTDKMNARFVKDPEAFVKWATDQIVDMRADKLATKKARELAKAMATEEVNDTLRNVPTPVASGPGGGGSTGSAPRTIEQYLALPSRERLKLKRDNPQLVDRIVASASR